MSNMILKFMKKDKYKEIIKNLISVGIEFKMHNNRYPVIYSKTKIDPKILEIAIDHREGIARTLNEEKEELLKSYNDSEGANKFFYKTILEEKFNQKMDKS